MDQVTQVQAVFPLILKEVVSLARAESEIKLPMGINQGIVDQVHTIQAKVDLDLLKVDVLGNIPTGITQEGKGGKEDKEGKEDKGSES